MKRRDFGKTLASGVIGAGVAGSVAPFSANAAAAPRKNTLMHVGGDYHYNAGGRGGDLTGKANLEFNVRHGVKHLTSQMTKRSADGGWDLDELKRMKDSCDKYGVMLEAIRMDSDYIMLRKGPERDRMLETIAGNVQKASQVGVKVITHHWTVIPIRRNAQVPGRGGSTYEAFKLEPNWKELPVGKAGVVSQDDYWERITYFLQHIIPVCKQHDVRMAAHPYDPPGLPFGYQGAENWDSPSVFDGFKNTKRSSTARTTDFNCAWAPRARGTEETPDRSPTVAQYLAERGKIHQIHMRNIRGGLDDFAGGLPGRRRHGLRRNHAHSQGQPVCVFHLRRSHAESS